MSSEAYMLNGYHGTSLEAYGKIKKHGFICKHRINHWLGQGIYFFHDDKKQAKWFASQCLNVKFLKQEPCILRAEINVDCIRFLNMNTTDGYDTFKETFDAIKKIINVKDIEIKTTGKIPVEEVITCIAYDNIKNVDVIMKVFPHNESSKYWRDEAAKYLEPSHTQICVRNIDCINNVSIIDRG